MGFIQSATCRLENHAGSALWCSMSAASVLGRHYGEWGDTGVIPSDSGMM
jgi:hypothetical protein